MTRAVRIIVPRMSGLPMKAYHRRKPANALPCDVRKALTATITNTAAAVRPMG